MPTCDCYTISDLTLEEYQSIYDARRIELRKANEDARLNRKKTNDSVGVNANGERIYKTPSATLARPLPTSIRIVLTTIGRICLQERQTVDGQVFWVDVPVVDEDGKFRGYGYFPTTWDSKA